MPKIAAEMTEFLTGDHVDKLIGWCRHMGREEQRKELETLRGKMTQPYHVAVRSDHLDEYHSTIPSLGDKLQGALERHIEDNSVQVGKYTYFVA